MLPFSETWRTALWLCAGAAAFLFGERLAIRYGAGALARRWVGLPAGGLVALGCAARFGGVQAVLALIACVLLYALGRVDAATMVLPDPLCALLGLLALPWVLAARLGGAAGGPLLFEHTVSAVTISLPLALLRRVWPGCLGGGDVKFLAAAGLWLGWAVVPAFLLATLAAGAWSVAGVAAGRLRPGVQFAFGPFLCAAAVVALFGSEEFIGWFYGGML